MHENFQTLKVSKKFQAKKNVRSVGYTCTTFFSVTQKTIYKSKTLCKSDEKMFETLTNNLILFLVVFTSISALQGRNLPSLRVKVKTSSLYYSTTVQKANSTAETLGNDRTDGLLCIQVFSVRKLEHFVMLRMMLRSSSCSGQLFESILVVAWLPSSVIVSALDT